MTADAFNTLMTPDDDNSRVVDFEECFDREHAVLKLMPLTDAITCNRYSNLAHAGLITAYARLYLLKLMELAKDADIDAEVVYVDTVSYASYS